MQSAILNLLLQFNILTTFSNRKKVAISFLLFCSLDSFSQVTIKDKAFIKIENKLLFESEFNRYKKRVSLVDCLFGESIGKEFLTRNRVKVLDQIVFYLKLEKYVNSIGFNVEKQKIASLLRNRLVKCNVNELDKSLIRAIHTELYLQEYLLNFSKESDKINSFEDFIL